MHSHHIGGQLRATPGAPTNSYPNFARFSNIHPQPRTRATIERGHNSEPAESTNARPRGDTRRASERPRREPARGPRWPGERPRERDRAARPSSESDDRESPRERPRERDPRAARTQRRPERGPSATYQGQNTPPQHPNQTALINSKTNAEVLQTYHNQTIECTTPTDPSFREQRKTQPQLPQASQQALYPTKKTLPARQLPTAPPNASHHHTPLDEPTASILASHHTHNYPTTPHHAHTPTHPPQVDRERPERDQREPSAPLAQRESPSERPERATPRERPEATRARRPGARDERGAREQTRRETRGCHPRGTRGEPIERPRASPPRDEPRSAREETSRETRGQQPRARPAARPA
uniref:Uncharacterized protein n=1 Tax=Knipowitschia caucasica TaxID=637954 RepID=A0AAV2JFH9_KNICA